MPKYEIEIPDGVLPEGTVPVAYRKPRPEDHYLSSVNSQHVCHAPKGKFCEKEAFLIVEKRPEPKFKVGDKVIVGIYTKATATIHSVGSNADGPYYCLQYPKGTIGTVRWYENELKPYTEPELPPAKFKVGDYALLNNKAVIILSDRQRGITLDGKEGSPRYIVRPAKGDDLSVTEESLTLVDPPKFKVGDWVKNTGNGSSVYAITGVKWWDWGKVWWYVLDNNTGSIAYYLKPATRVPLTQDDAVKLALGAITPKDIQLEDKRFERSLAHCQAKQLGRNEAGPTLWLKDPKEVWDTAYPISDLTRLV